MDINIAGTLHNTEEIEGDALHSHVVAKASEILDETKSKKQSEVNSEVGETLVSHESRLNAFTEGNFVTVESFSALPATGSVDTVYRVSSWDGTANSGQGAADVTKYSEYAWENGAYKFLDVKTQIGEVFDISEYNNSTYADLEAALSGTNVPTAIRRGGMSVKYVQTSDNKYVQFRYMSSSTATADFTNVANWQGVDDEPTAGSDNLVKGGGVEKNIELRKSSVFHINGEGITSIRFDGFNINSFHFDMDFVILPNENNVYKDIVIIADSNGVNIQIGYYTSANNKNWYIGERLQSSAQYYKEYHLNIYYDNNLLCVYINDILMKTFSVSTGLAVIFGKISVEPIGEMLVNYLNFYDNQKFYGIDSITDHYNATLVENYILKEIEIMRSEQFDQIGSDKVQWIDGTIGDIQSLVFDDNSLGISSYVITYKDYVVTQPTITYNNDYQISNKPEIVITKSN